MLLPNEMRILLGFWFIKPTTATKGNLGTMGEFLIQTAILANFGKLTVTFLRYNNGTIIMQDNILIQDAC